MNQDRREDVDINKREVRREENPGLVGSTFIKYAAYIVILLIVLYFIVKFIFPMFG